MAWVTKASIPEAHNFGFQGVVAEYNNKLYLIGGRDEVFDPITDISVYDPATDSWSDGGDLNVATAPGGRQAAVIGSVAYWLDPELGALRWVDLSDLSEGTGSMPDGYVEAAVVDLVAYDGKVYWFGATTPEAYDPTGGTWTELATAPASLETLGYVDANTGIIYVIYVGFFGAYNVATNTWQTLTGPGVDVEGPLGRVIGSKLYLAGGFVGESDTNDVRSYDITSGAWQSEDDLPFTDGAATVLVGGVATVDGDAVFLALAQASNFSMTLYGLDIVVPVIIEVEASVNVTLSVELPVSDVGEAYVTVIMDVAGGPGVSASVYVTLNTGQDIIATAPVTIDVDDDPPSWTAPAISTPSGATPVIAPRAWTDCEAPRVREICNSDEYAIDWRPGGQATGTVKGYGSDATPTPEDGLNLEADFDATLEWQYGTATTIARAYIPSTVEKATSFELPELMPVDGMEALPGMLVGGCLKPITSSLCSDTDIIISCIAQDLLPEILPTRLQLAYQAAEAASITLFVLNGTAGLPQANEVVDADYRTEGKTLATVLQELLLGGGAAHWYAPGAVLVNGGGLPEAVFARPTIYGQEGSVTQQAGEAFSEDEPLLATYLEDCHDLTSESDACEGETFETAASGTLSWTEQAGSGRTYTEVETTLVKSGGQIVREEIIKRRMQWRLEIDLSQPGGIGGTSVLAPSEWTVREYTYLACCPSALTHSVERVWVAPRNNDPNADWESAYGVNLASYKEVTQRWHAEGWLASRIESTWTQHGFRTGWGGDPTPSVAPDHAALGHLRVIPTYKVQARTETYAPVGRGMWYVNVTVTDAAQLPVDDGTTPTLDVVGSHWGDIVNSWTQVTDQAPPSVTCGEPGVDPCSDDDCSTVRTAEWQADHDAWAAKAAAWLLNNPTDRIITSITYPERITSLLPGTLRDEGMVAAVSWQGAGVRTNNPGERTTIEYWGGLGS